MSKSYSGGVSGSSGIPGILSVSSKFNYGNIFSEADLTENSEVASIEDAVGNISESRTEFLPFDDRKGGFKPTAAGMKKYLGAILFVCNFLEGRAKPIGRFKKCSADLYSKDGWMQIVDFDLPLSIGIVSSTLIMKNDAFSLPTSILSGPNPNQSSEAFKQWFVEITMSTQW